MSRFLAIALVASVLVVPAYAQAPNAADASADGQAVQLPRTSPIPETNAFKLSAGDFKHFFRYDTLKTLSIVGVVAVASAPWDREGVNNGFNIPTTVFQSGNVIGNFLFQTGAGFATYGAAKAFGSEKGAVVGRDIVRAQLLSQAMVQATKFTIRRERPDGSDHYSFPSGHSASAFATATVLQNYYGWKVGVPAYVLGGYVGLARMSWNRHHATDVVMGAGVGIAAAKTVTMSVGQTRFSVGVQPQRGGASLNFTKINK
jgi:membrane-associated phospholipid phosphatase